MREFMVPTLILLCCLPAAAQSARAGWQSIKDAKGLCQIEVPPDWAPFGEAIGAAVLRDPSTAIAVVTSQPGQEYKPFTAAFIKTMAVPKEKMFENSATRIFYQDKTSANRDDPSAFSSSVPAKGGTCSCHLVFLPMVPEEIARKVVLSLSPVPPKS